MSMTSRLRRTIVPVAIVAALALASTAATCRTAPRHTAHLSLNALVKGLAGAQDGEFVLFKAGKVTPDKHAAIQARVRSVAQMIDDGQTVLDAWQPGQPVPHVLGQIIAAASPLVDDILALAPFDEALQAQIKKVYKAIGDILILVAG
jgi:hypothetical protein